MVKLLNMKYKVKILNERNLLSVSRELTTDFLTIKMEARNPMEYAKKLISFRLKKKNVRRKF